MPAIDRRSLLKGVGAVGASSLVEGTPGLAASARKQPNIVLIVSDQERSPGDLPTGFTRRHFDRLRERAVSFTQYHTPTAPCAPARAVLYTGLHTQKNGIVANPGSGLTRDLDPRIPTLGSYLRSAGYRTFYKGKWHLSHIAASREGPLYRTAEDALEPYGFSQFNYHGDPTGHAWSGLREDYAIACEAADLIGRLAISDAPWFVAVNFVNPHDIMFFDATGEQHATRAVRNLISPMRGAPSAPPFDRRWNLPLPASFGRDDLANKPETQRLEMEYLDLVYGHMPLSNEQAWQRFQDYYLNCLTHLDANLGIVLDALTRHRMIDRTMVIYTSDHGERGGAHGLRQKGGDMYRENLRVPLLVSHPDGARGAETTSLASSLDIVPTIAAFAGGWDRSDHAFPGVSLAPVVGRAASKTARDHRGILFNYEVRMRDSMSEARARLTGKPLPDGSPPDRILMRGIHTGNYKFARYFRPDEHHLPQSRSELRERNDLELYDVKADPDELINLADDAAHSGRVEALNRQLNDLIGVEVGTDDGTVLAAAVGTPA